MENIINKIIRKIEILEDIKKSLPSSSNEIDIKIITLKELLKELKNDKHCKS